MTSTPEIPGLKFATPRNPDRYSRGPRQAKFAKVWYGREFMPHQQLIADVGGELQPNGLPYYTLIVTTMQRRGGKTDLDMAIASERCFTVPRFQSWACAQTGKDSRDAFLKFTDTTLAETPLSKVVRTRRGNGHEDMTFPNSSIHRPHPPTEESLHGKDSDRNSVDEGWAHSEEEGKLLMQAIAPTQLTRPGAQTWIWSAGGTAASTWLAGLVAKGRAGATAIELGDGPPIRMAYFELGVPDDLDVTDVEAVAHYHPAFGYTINLEAFFALREQMPDDNDWARAAGNRWTEVIGGVISAAHWRAVRDNVPPIPAGVPVGYGASRSEDGSQVVIAVAGELEDGRVVVEILDVLPTAHRSAEYVSGWASDGGLAIYPSGGSSKLRADLEDIDRELVPMKIGEAIAACATVEDSLEPRAILFRGPSVLDDVVPIVGKRRVQSGGWLWANTGEGQIAGIEAATAAVHALRPKHRPRPQEKPALAFGVS